MAGSKYQKLKTLYILRFLESHTDEEHGVTTEEIISHLDSLGIGAERKSIYSDIELLRNMGMDIETVREGRTEYRLMSREFQLAELKLLVDAVGASRFITRKKSLELIKKLEGLTSIYEARQLRRSVYVDRRIKSMNESIYYNVDALHTAINTDHMLRFRYFNYSRNKERVPRREGEPYIVSPLALTFSDGNYYLYACEENRDGVRTYRVDRMADATILDEKRDIPKELHDFDPAVHANESFSMYHGDRRSVTLSFADSLATVVIDRFGSDATLVPGSDGRFSITVDVMVSPTFLGWIFGFGADAIITAPDDVARQLADMAQHVADLYK